MRDGLLGLAAAVLIEIDSDHGGSADAITVHPVVADVNRSRMLTDSTAGFSAIADTAVKLLGFATTKLDSRLSSDWPTWRQIIPHVTAVLEWMAPHLCLDVLVELLKISDQAENASWHSGNRVIAERLALTAVSAAERLPEDHPDRLAARSALAAVIAGKGGHHEAELTYQQILAGQERVLGSDHPDTLTTHQRLAWESGSKADTRKPRRSFVKCWPIA